VNPYLAIVIGAFVIWQPSLIARPDAMFVVHGTLRMLENGNWALVYKRRWTRMHIHDSKHGGDRLQTCLHLFIFFRTRRSFPDLNRFEGDAGTSTEFENCA
jgi:hypothetical protein